MVDGDEEWNLNKLKVSLDYFNEACVHLLGEAAKHDMMLLIQRELRKMFVNYV